MTMAEPTKSSKSEAKSARDPWAQVQRVFFARIKVRTPAGVRTTTRIEDYLERLTMSAAKGDLHANREKQILMSYLDRHDILQRQTDVDSAGSVAMKKRMDDHKRLCDFADKVKAIVYLGQHHEIEARYGLTGDPHVSLEVMPQHVDLDGCKPALMRIRRMARRPSPQVADVGYKRPPVSTRWSIGQSGNPSGQRRPKDDFWESFRSGLSQSLTVVKGGRQVEMTSGEVIVTRLFDKASQDNKTARVQLRQLLIALDTRGLVRPPKSSVRRRPRITAPSDVAKNTAMNKLAFLLARAVRREMVASLDEAYGPVGDWETSLERNLRQRLPRDADTQAWLAKFV